MANNSFITGLGGILNNVFGGSQQNSSELPFSADTKPKIDYKPSIQFLNKFRGKNVLVTGASGGIGTEVCKQLLKSDVQRLCLFMRDISHCDANVSLELQSRVDKDRFRLESLDFINPQRVQQRFQQAIKSHFFGQLDAVILCHGIVVEKGTIGCTIPDFDQTMLVNVRSMVHMISLSMPFLKQQTSASVTLLTSAQGLHPDPMSTVMSVSAAMVHQLIKCTALEGAYHGVRVNGVAVGVTNTKARTRTDLSATMKLTEQENKTYLQLAAQDVPLEEQIIQPRDAADAILFLASDDSSFTNGEILCIDGGQSLTTDKYDDYVSFLKREFE